MAFFIQIERIKAIRDFLSETYYQKNALDYAFATVFSISKLTSKIHSILSRSKSFLGENIFDHCKCSVFHPSSCFFCISSCPSQSLSMLSMHVRASLLVQDALFCFLKIFTVPYKLTNENH